MRNGYRNLSYVHTFNGICYSCKTYGHKFIKCKTNKNFGNIRMNDRKPQKGLICHNCNNMGHIARNYKSKIERFNGPKRKIDLNKEKEKMKMKWVKSNVETNEKIMDGYAPFVGVDPSSNRN